MDIFQTFIDSIVVSACTPRAFQVNLRLQQDDGLETLPPIRRLGHEVMPVHAVQNRHDTVIVDGGGFGPWGVTKHKAMSHRQGRC